VITPRNTRLVRVPDLQSMHAFVARSTATPEARSCAVVVPTRGAAEALRRTLEDLCLAHATALLLPDFVTREDFYDRLYANLPDAPRRLTPFDREVIFRSAAEASSQQGAPAPFRLRAGLVVEILAFYDELRRRDRTTAAFARNMLDALESNAHMDRGAERLLQLTRFLAAAFEAFELRVDATGLVDEHGLRRRLLEASASFDPPYGHVVVTVADEAADPHGLWLADYDLLARIPGIARIDVVATEQLLATGYHERIHEALPGIEEERFATATAVPVLAVPAPQESGEAIRWFVSRDREEELADFARDLKRRRINGLDRTAVVFQRPLPYLYLARQVFPDAQMPYQGLDALPLAGEPFAAALDLMFSFLVSEATRPTLVALLRSPHFAFAVDGRALTRADIAVADRELRTMKYSGGWDRLNEVAEGHPSISALRAASAAAAVIRRVTEASTASRQIETLLEFIAMHERLPQEADPWHARHLRARAAILGGLQSLGIAHRAHDDRPVPVADLTNTVRRWIESQTFSPRNGSRGVILLDATSAAYADLDEVRLVGLVESDWPDRNRRSIFYPSSLLTQLGWAKESDRLNAARARFHDLLRAARQRVSVSTFTLEADVLVPASPFLDELEEPRMAIEHVPATQAARVFVHEGLSEEPVESNLLSGPAREWLDVRVSRTASAELTRGAAGARPPAVYAVSSVERYLDCPFKYFASYVLRLQEERDDEAGMTPLERGLFLHSVFEMFFDEWQRAGRGTINTQNVADAVALFHEIAEAQLATLPESDRAVERTHLLGSAAAPGLAERAFAFEIEQGGDVVERLLEHELEGAFLFTASSATRRLELRAKADRIDLMADGTLRVVDYKLGKAPKPGRALQLSVYGVCAEQALAGRHNRTWTLGRAGYVAFKEKNAFVALGAGTSLRDAVESGQQRLLAAVDAIERGEFPARPDEPFLCTRCGYATVCRKDYVGDE
jgi:RecB family exonuclease